MTTDYEDFEEIEIEFIKGAITKLEKQTMEWGFLDRFDFNENCTATIALKKQIPCEACVESNGDADGGPVYDSWECPRCGTWYDMESDGMYKYCPKCGQAIKWETI